MASKLDYLLQVFEKNEFRHLKGSLPSVTENTFQKSGAYKESLEIYKELGGMPDLPPWIPPKWDLEFENLAIKLDTEINFNRYRNITFKSNIYQNCKSFNVESYKRYCRQYEQDCLKVGRYAEMWTDRESEKYFGPSQEGGELALKGSSKWKLRAFSDHLEDVATSLVSFKIIRISIYENIMINNKLIKLDTLLLYRNAENEKYLWNYLKRRIGE